MKNKIVLLLLPLILIPAISIAQTPLFDLPTESNRFDSITGIPDGIIEQISVEILPKVPSPNERVNIFVQSFSSDLNKGYFVWRINGVNQLEGNGETSFSFSAPESGRSLTVSLFIEKEDGGTITRSFDFSPADVDIVYEAETYTPPFYKGKALFTSESTFRLIAMPNFLSSNGNRVSPNTLIYNWSINGTNIQSQSGYGKRVFRGEGGIVQRPLNVSVEVSASNSGLRAKGDIFLNYSEPEVVLYENNPLLGFISERAISGEFLLERPEIELQAVPYFFSTPQKDSSFINYKWKMNGNDLLSSGDSFVNFRNDSGEAGRARISLETEHFSKILQITQSVVNLNFEKNDAISENIIEF